MVSSPVSSIMARATNAIRARATGAGIMRHGMRILRQCRRIRRVTPRGLMPACMNARPNAPRVFCWRVSFLVMVIFLPALGGQSTVLPSPYTP